MKRDWQDVIQFYVDDDDLQSLEQMGSFKKWLFSTWWLLQGMFFKLTPARRIILLISIVLFLDGVGSADGTIVLSFLGMLLILMLELKDKLLAQDELQSGRAVQLALMPDRNPVFEGWDIWLYTEPANDVGGDLVDYLYLGENKLAVALGDVAGKGLPAALFMAKLQATVRAVAPTIKSLSDLAAEINRIFWRDKLPNRFASLLYAEIEGGSGTLKLINAGHLPPAIVDRNEVGFFAEAGDTAIGLVESATYQERTIELEPGETLVIYSDGVTEARNEEGAFFGEGRLATALEQVLGRSASEVGRGVVNAVDNFVGSARPSDDLSIIVLRKH
jgi:sigma-B regulation protein RsbU (phosphoserine phosphatase)